MVVKSSTGGRLNDRTRSREVTHLSSGFVSKLVSAEHLENSLSAGSKKRLTQYRKNLNVSRGVEKPLFDDKILDVLRRYAKDPKNLEHQLEYLNNLRDPDGYKFSRDLKIYSNIEKALATYATPDHPSFRWNQNYQSALEWLKLQFSKSKLKPLQFGSDDDIRAAIPKEGTHSGYYWIETGNKKKGDNLDGIYNRFSSVVAEALERGTMNRPVLIGFRTQAMGEYDDEGACTGTCKHKTRMVQMFDLLSIVLELQFSNPFQEVIGGKEVYAGGKDEYQLHSIITDMKQRGRYYYSIDYSNFDATISSWLIEDAFSVIKSAFILNPEQEKMFDIMEHDFIHKTLILNEGEMRVHRGVPSGSMWTQIVDSLVNLLAIKTYFIAMGHDVSMTTMGDDNVIFTNWNTSIANLASYVCKNFGLDIKIEDKSAMGLSAEKKGIKFLSRFWRWDGQYRHPNQLLSRMLFPERFRAYNEEVTPELVVYAFILTYGLGMAELIDCIRFMQDNRLIKKEMLFEKVDSRYLPGSLAFIREYTKRRDPGLPA